MRVNWTRLFIFPLLSYLINLNSPISFVLATWVPPRGGTHVANTNEIGEFKFIKYESKGKMNKRVQFTLI